MQTTDAKTAWKHYQQAQRQTRPHRFAIEGDDVYEVIHEPNPENGETLAVLGQGTSQTRIVARNRPPFADGDKPSAMARAMLMLVYGVFFIIGFVSLFIVITDKLS